MVGGQLLDLAGESKALTLAELEQVHLGKTGALIAASARLGGLAAGADQRGAAALDGFGRAIGLAFQIADDVLDVTATTDQLGKTAGRDLALRKSTYPALLGVTGAAGRAAALASTACDGLRAARLLTPELEALARFAVERRA
jgi:geranylgeranyl pyrophosphate synthase